MTSPLQKEAAKEHQGAQEAERKIIDPVDVTKVLQVKRWQLQETPFRGFGSPPGRF